MQSDSTDLGIARTSDLVIIQITLSAGRTLVEVAKENRSFGDAVASYAPAEAQSA